MKHKHLFIFLLLESLCVMWCYGRPVKYIHRNISRDSALVLAYMDSLRTYKIKADSVIFAEDSLKDNFKTDARFFRFLHL